MADLLPSLRDTDDAGGDEPRVLGMDSEDADDVLAALSSRTARRILATLHDDPATPSELADSVDTSLQNVQYHLDRLGDAGVVEVADTTYSEKGREMNVYAPADRALVVVAGDETERTGIRAAISRLLGGLGVLLLGSVLVQFLLDPPDIGGTGGAPTDGGAGGSGVDGASGDDAGTGGGAGGATETAQPTAEPTAEATRTAAETATPAATVTPAPTPVASAGGPDLVEALTALPPGALFFFGGATMLALGVLWLRLRR